MGKQGKTITKNYKQVQSRIKWDEIGKRLKQIQDELKAKNGGRFSQKNMGELCGHKQGDISDYQNGKNQPDLETLDRIARYSGHTLSWLVYGEEEIPIDQKEKITIRQYGKMLYWLIQLTGAKVEEEKDKDGKYRAGMKVLFSENFANVDYAYDGPNPIPWNESRVFFTHDGERPFLYNFAAWQITILLENIAASQKANSSLQAAPGMDWRTLRMLRNTLDNQAKQAVNDLVDETPLQAYEKEKTAHEYDDYEQEREMIEREEM